MIAPVLSVRQKQHLLSTYPAYWSDGTGLEIEAIVTCFPKTRMRTTKACVALGMCAAVEAAKFLALH